MKIVTHKEGGFTLIELLVVIAIIGILSAVVVASLGVARARAGDSAVKAGLTQLGPQSQSYLDAKNGSLGESVST